MSESRQPTGQRRLRGSRFVSAPSGLNARYTLLADGAVEGVVTLAAAHEGPPGIAHGGALAALLDEAMGAASWAAGHRALAVNLNVAYKRPVPLGVEIRVFARIAGVDGRKVFTAGEIVVPGDIIAAQGSGVFVEAPQFFQPGDGFTLDEPDSPS